MPVFYPPPQTITMLPSGPWPSHDHAYPREREVNRETLLDVAPDREALLTSNKSIDELRQILKIRVGPVPSHWLYRRRKRVNATLRDGNTRISTLIRGAPPTSNETNSSKKEIHVLRRVLSTSSVSPFSHQMINMDNRFLRPSPYGDHDIDVWGTVMLSTEQLISPRPLGPTHILIAHSNPGPSRAWQPVTSGVKRTLRRKLSSALSNVVELPINDLLFVLNIPNLVPAAPILPPRLHKELPRVLMYVPHLETFPELVVYLHTQNQAELFRSLVPEWIRDLMHPLPDPMSTSTGNTAVISFGDSRNIARVPLQLLGMLIPGSSSGSNSSAESLPSAYYDAPSGAFEYRRTARSVAEEIAEVAQAPVFAESGEPDPILHTVALLNVLRDNLEYIGCYGNALWIELDVYRDVLIRAVSCQAKIRGDGDYEE